MRKKDARRELFPKRKRLGMYRRTGDCAMIPCYDKRGGWARRYCGDADGIDGLYYDGTEVWN